MAVATAEQGKLDGVGGIRLHFRAWRPAQSPRGVVAIVPGFNSHSGYYIGDIKNWIVDRLPRS